MALTAWICEKSDAVVWWLPCCLLFTRHFNAFLTLPTNLSPIQPVIQSLNFCSCNKSFSLSKILLYFFKTRNHPSYIPMNQFIQLYMPCVFAFCLHSLQRQMFPWLFIPSEYFLALLPTEALSPLTTLKKLYINLMQLLMIISLSFWCHCCFLLCGKKDNPPALFCLQEVTSDNKTLWKLQDIKKDIAFYS